ncbi:putative Zn-dependent protease [Silvibacterium bohemicum]|uniref:Putative Zn-dependent protease n=1 Tax=Silvibacterium bohemicum TaxID=1577686 RepID=A0A841K5G9_9BACT|nr:metallopeptidase TldD-related protein [Silvibacterium bohemicum]MBB6145514.1 putative Zn-dependent protease [Silvibacterium bohemicum]
MNSRMSLFGAALILSSLASAQQMAQQMTQQVSTSAADAQKDPVLKAMLAELDRSKQQLQLPGFEKPYFIEYRIDEIGEYKADASYGAFVGEQAFGRRIVRVTVRSGDYKLDSSGERGQGSLQIATTDNDPLALQYALWSATDTAYKAALNNYTAKQAALKSVQTPPQADDFSQEKAVVSIAPLAKSELDQNAWKQRIIEATGLYRNDSGAKDFAQEIETSEGSVQSRTRTEYLVNSEGAIVRKSMVEYRAEVTAQTQAADGMRLERSYGVTGLTPADLGTAERFRNGVIRILTGLHELRSAPVIGDEYHGPVLFAGNASARTFDDLFAHAVAARRPQLGSTARTVGPFASSYKTRVLPDFIKVVDDPGITEFKGKPVLGAYTIDDEGVPAQSVTLVDGGKLTNYLVGREPIRDFPNSNGHARAATAQPASPQIGVLQVEASETIPDDELMKKLVAMGKDQGLDSVYFVETISGASRPRTLYRIKVADGSRELVRGAELEDVNLRLLRSGILAAGSEPYVFNSFGEIPRTVIAPPLLFDDVTVKRAEQRNDKLPYYPPPD